MLAPLTKLSGLKGSKLPWTDKCQKAFDQMKALLAQEAFLACPNCNQPFHICVHASNVQLGSAIFQNKCLVVHHSRKLNSARCNYTTGEKELLSIVEILRKFRAMLCGCPEIHIHADHKNNTFQNIQTQRVMHWRMFLEDCGIQLHCVKGVDNHLADTLS